MLSAKQSFVHHFLDPVFVVTTYTDYNVKITHSCSKVGSFNVVAHSLSKKRYNGSDDDSIVPSHWIPCRTHPTEFPYSIHVTQWTSILYKHSLCSTFNADQHIYQCFEVYIWTKNEAVTSFCQESIADGKKVTITRNMILFRSVGTFKLVTDNWVSSVIILALKCKKK